ncbi:MAG TPA: chemotaxis protein CheW [Bryobacteraceae bacterium]|jgi:chemotaxis signal transduction protein|nr:chemotaxis protein CheW [Bryobacteraceae bacterium]
MTASVIRWEEVHERLRRSERFLSETLAETPERIEAVFRRRALELAREHTARYAAPGLPALIFTAVGENYAIALHQLAEVAPLRGCTPVPGAMRGIAGVLNLRGSICPVIDLGMVLSGSPSADGGSALILRAPATGVPAVLKADSVREVREIHSAGLGDPVGPPYLRPVPAGGFALLDAEAMLRALFPGKESRPQ